VFFCGLEIADWGYLRFLKIIKRLEMKKLILILCLLFGVKSTNFAQTGNNCANAIIATLGSTFLDSITATPASHRDAHKAKWYKFTPAADGVMTIQSCLQNTDTRLWVYAGRCDSLIQYAAGDDDCEFRATSHDLRAASVTKAVKGGNTYYIEWDNRWDSTRFMFTISMSNIAPTAGQACATAKIIPAAGGTLRVDSMTGYFASRGDANRAAWYQYTPTRTGRLSIASCGGGTNTRFWLYEGTCAQLNLVADGDDDCSMTPTDILGLAAATANISVMGGRTYYIEWDNAYSDEGFDFTVNFDIANNLNDANWVKNLEIYPNPTQQSFWTDFDFVGSQPIEWRVFNWAGQLLERRAFAENGRGNIETNVSDWQSGLYILEWSNGQQKVHRKLVVQH
jgi:hypothetical protein